MPSAQTHLAAARDLLASSFVEQALPWLGSGEARSAFLLGTISPDVRAISGHPREATHFFAIPPADARPAPQVMFDRWPTLGDAPALGAVRAAFVAGYATHLIMDQAWVEIIVMPNLFIDGLAWGTDHPNWRLYSLLMTYIEYQAADRFHESTITYMQRAEPQGWLPFVQDRHLVEWRDRVIATIRGGGARLVSRMFARSNNLPPGALDAIVLSEERMAAEVYPVVPRQRLQQFEAESARRSRDTVLSYLADVPPPAGGAH
jgi:hypothetical protein